MKNQAMVMTDVRKLEKQEIPMPVIEDEEVGIEVCEIGICGSDMHFYEGKAFTIFPDSLPFILGHECAGIVYSVGARVKNLKIGDRVAIEPGQTCGKCEFCQTGRYNLCPDVQFLATPPYSGALKKYMSYPAYRAFKLPDNMSTMEGALIEPLSVGIHAAIQGEVSIGKTVVILGGGCIGLCTLLAAKAYGATRIIVTDLFDNRLDKASEIGAPDTINSKDEVALSKILELTEGSGADIVFVTAGSPVAAAQTSHIVK
ncbi:MAG: alcohol dehydrogenase catalytic domain-containing protein [Suipraeoptans sp.]